MDKIRFGYFQAVTPRGTGYICVALRRPTKELNETEPHHAAFSFCSPKDRFNKKLARMIATNRLEFSKKLDCNWFVEFFTTAPNNKLATIKALESAIKKGRVPRWVDVAADRNKITVGLTQGTTELLSF